jgi:tRNA (guanine-N7-)-methyltransferase
VSQSTTEVAPASEPHPPIRSFKPRRGRVTQRQQRAIDELWSSYAVEVSDQPLDPPAVFGRRAPLVFEIGFGMGEATAAMAEADPSRDVLAIDVHTPGLGSLLHDVVARGLTNVRVMLGDGVDVLRDMLGPGSLDELRVFFPDPWPKVRHHKRRLLDDAFVDLAAQRLAPGGRLHVATDWAEYAEQVLEVTAAHGAFVNRHGGYAPRPASRPVTRFERQGLAKGHEVFDLVLERAR